MLLLRYRPSEEWKEGDAILLSHEEETQDSKKKIFFGGQASLCAFCHCSTVLKANLECGIIASKYNCKTGRAHHGPPELQDGVEGKVSF